MAGLERPGGVIVTKQAIYNRPQNYLLVTVLSHIGSQIQMMRCYLEVFFQPLDDLDLWLLV